MSQPSRRRQTGGGVASYPVQKSRFAALLDSLVDFHIGRVGPARRPRQNTRPQRGATTRRRDERCRARTLRAPRLRSHRGGFPRVRVRRSGRARDRGLRRGANTHAPARHRQKAEACKKAEAVEGLLPQTIIVVLIHRVLYKDTWGSKGVARCLVLGAAPAVTLAPAIEPVRVERERRDRAGPEEKSRSVPLR